jgi:acetyltransferase-like isoleucine patch superfamily enzyme
MGRPTRSRALNSTIVTAGQIVAYLRECGMATAVIGAPADTPLTAVATDARARSGAIAWSRRPGTAAAFKGSLLVCSRDAADGVDGPAAPGQVIVVCEQPRLAMAHVITRFFGHLAADRPAVYADPQTAVRVAEVGAWVRNAVIGHNVQIDALATVGSSGMGYERDGDGRLVPFPQIGGVVLEDDVHIAAQAMVQRGALGDTIIRRGAKIGPHVNVAHNSQVGEDSLLTGHSQLAGGVRIGRRVVVWQSAAIGNGVTVGDDAVIGMGAMIRTDVGAGEVWVGNPGKRLR